MAGFESRVINGKDWEDTLEDMVVAAGGAAAGFASSMLATAAVNGTSLATYSGPIGIVAGFIGTVIYEAVLAPVVKEKASEFADA